MFALQNVFSAEIVMKKAGDRVAQESVSLNVPFGMTV